MRDYEEINLFTPGVKRAKRRMSDRHPVLTLVLVSIPLLPTWTIVLIDSRAGNYAHLSYSQAVTLMLTFGAISVLMLLWGYRRL
jgi:hypothetical protein